MLTRIFKGRRADDALFDQFCQSIEDLHAEKANLCEANDALVKENRNLRLELAKRAGGSRRTLKQFIKGAQ